VFARGKLGDMRPSEMELEVKFWVPNFTEIENKLKHLSARLVQPRTYEKNLRLDTHDRKLTTQHEVLRLRWDTAARCTYKGKSVQEQGIQKRVEIEFEVSNFDAALHLFQALGYETVMIYEKYRTTYQYNSITITLDEMPFGNFIEIEGESGETIQQCSELLGLDWERRILFSYAEIFERIKKQYQLSFRDLTFENFNSLVIPFSIQGILQ